MLPAVLKDEPQFRLLFAGQVLSLVGDRIAMVAWPFAVLSVGGGAGDVGLVAAAQFAPFAVLALVAGVVADRLDRRAVMIASDVVRLVVQAVAAVLLLSDEVGVGGLAVLAVLYGSADAFFQPAMTGLLPQTVSAPRLQDANALRGMTYSVGSVAGPALAGVLVAVAGPGGAFAFDAVTFAVSVACLVALRPRVVDRAAAAAASFAGDLRGGWRAVRARPWVQAGLASLTGYHVVVLPAIFVLGPVLMDERYGGAGDWAVITAAFGAGAILGDVVLLRWRPRRALLTGMLLLVGASCQAAIIGSGLPVAAIAALEFLTGGCVTAYFTLWTVSLQEHVPEDVLSRVSSYDFLASTGTVPLGAALAGLLAGPVGLQPLLVGMSVVGVACALACCAVPAVRGLRRPAPAPH